LIGPLPADIQNYTVYRGARSTKSTQVQAAEAFISAMSGPEAIAILKDKGMERPN
jgi:molybdate transport system substrate-binding protein